VSINKLHHSEKEVALVSINILRRIVSIQTSPQKLIEHIIIQKEKISSTDNFSKITGLLHIGQNKVPYFFQVFQINGVLDNFSLSTFSQRPIKMENNGENRFHAISQSLKINFKGALSCRFPFQNTAPCCDVKTVPKHNLEDAAGCASHGGLLPTWSATAFRDVLTK